MAVFRFGKEAVDLGANSQSYFSRMYSYAQTQVTLSATEWRGGENVEDYVSIKGKNFSYTNVSGPLRLLTGTISSINLLLDNTSLMAISEIKLSGKNFGSTLFSGPEGLAAFVTKGNDTFHGTTLGDTLFAGAGKDTILGGAGDDRLDGQLGADLIRGGGGNDIIYSGSGDVATVGNRAYGDAGMDYLMGGAGNDLLFGGTDNDTIQASDGDDRLFGGDGNDMMLGNGGKDLQYGGAGNDTVAGEDGNDTLYGDAGSDTVDGGNQADKLYGGDGIDTVVGGAGADQIYGGLGSDFLMGGSEADRFVFDTALGAANVDTIVDFQVGIDKIVLDDDIFKAIGTVGNLAAGKFVLGTAANDANDRIIYDAETGKLYYDRDGNGAAAKVQIAALAEDLTLTAADFSIIG